MRDMKELGAALVEAEHWIDDLMRRLGWHDRDKVFSAMIAALHGLRDSLPREEAVFLASSLPPLLRGFYYEGWHARTPPGTRSEDAFLERIRDGVDRDVGIDADSVAHAVFAQLAARLPAAELEGVKAATPKALHFLWPV